MTGRCGRHPCVTCKAPKSAFPEARRYLAAAAAKANTPKHTITTLISKRSSICTWTQQRPYHWCTRAGDVTTVLATWCAFAQVVGVAFGVLRYGCRISRAVVVETEPRRISGRLSTTNLTERRRAPGELRRMSFISSAVSDFRDGPPKGESSRFLAASADSRSTMHRATNMVEFGLAGGYIAHADSDGDAGQPQASRVVARGCGRDAQLRGRFGAPS